MPRITQIKETKKGRYALFLDEEFAFSLDAATFADADLHEDDELDGAALRELQAKSDSRKALDRAMDILALRDHASGELYQKLCRKFDSHSAAAAVAKVQELGLLNDEDVARRRAAELMRKHKSRREILSDLAAKGIGRDAAAAAVEELYAAAPEDAPDPEQAAALALVQRQYARKLAEGKRENVAAALARRGFSHGTIRAVLARFEEEAETEE